MQGDGGVGQARREPAAVAVPAAVAEEPLPPVHVRAPLEPLEVPAHRLAAPGGVVELGGDRVPVGARPDDRDHRVVGGAAAQRPGPRIPDAAVLGDELGVDAGRARRRRSGGRSSPSAAPRPRSPRRGTPARGSGSSSSAPPASRSSTRIPARARLTAIGPPPAPEPDDHVVELGVPRHPPAPSGLRRPRDERERRVDGRDRRRGRRRAERHLAAGAGDDGRGHVGGVDEEREPKRVVAHLLVAQRAGRRRSRSCGCRRAGTGRPPCRRPPAAGSGGGGPGARSRRSRSGSSRARSGRSRWSSGR